MCKNCDGNSQFHVCLNNSQIIGRNEGNPIKTIV